MRETFLKALVLAGTACVAITEILSLFHGLTRWGVAVAWILAILAAVLFFKPLAPRFQFSALDAFYLVVIGGIVAIAGYTALVYPPNSADAMAYHLPRIIYWMQNRSVAFFPTPYLNQIMLQPFAEYAMAHTYLLSGGDHFVNLIQWTGFVGSIVAVSLIAEAMGLSRRGQVIAAVACATLPNAILQASGAKNDCVAAMWLAAMVYFALRQQFVLVALALGLALGTKATAYLFALPMLLAVWVIAKRDWRQLGVAIGAIGAGVLLLNLPQYARNISLSGSPLGFDSAFGDGSFRWRNESLGWKPTVSNVLRNVSEQLGGRSETMNRRIFDAVIGIHRTMNIDPQDPGTTWQWSQYAPPRNANQEADANNRWQFLLMAVALLASAFRRQKQWLTYSAGLAAAFLAFCFYLKWQPFFSRLELPLFVLGAPLIASLLDGLRPAVLSLAVCLFLLDGTRHPLLDNWTRPLRVPREPRDMAYFNDLTQFHDRDFLLGEVDRVAASGCEVLGIDINQNQLEYPLQALLREKNPRIRFVHVNVHNPSRRYARPDDPAPCATVQLR
jgi:hypothetical protein